MQTTPATSTSTLADDLSRVVRHFAPGDGATAFLQGRRQDVDALLALGRVAGEGAAAVLDHQLDTARDVAGALWAALAGHAAGEATRRDAVQEAARRAVGGIAGLAEVLLATQAEAFQTASQRALASVREFKSLAGAGR